MADTIEELYKRLFAQQKAPAPAPAPGPAPVPAPAPAPQREDFLSDTLMRLATGNTADELSIRGREVYPQENAVENQGGHRLAAKQMTDRFGPVASQVAGVANEGLEAAVRKATMGQAFPYGVDESVRDLAANWRGAQDSSGLLQFIQMMMRK